MDPGQMQGMHGGFGHFGAVPIVGLILTAIVVVVLVVGAIYLIRYIARITPAAGTPAAGGGTLTTPTGEDPLALLNRRLVKGEVDVEEYEKIKEHLV